MPKLSQDSPRFGIVRGLGAFLWQHKIWWMIPVILVAGIFGLLVIFGQSSMVAPFAYTF